MDGKIICVCHYNLSTQTDGSHLLNSACCKQTKRGWNYVDCMESIVWSDFFDPDHDCWKLTTFCRDVLSTPGMDEYSNGVTPNAFRSEHNSVLVLSLALFSGFVASAMVFVAMRGGCRKKQDEHGDVQFAAVRTHELMTD